MARKPYTPDMLKTGDYLASIWRFIQSNATLKDYERKELLRHINRIWSILTGLHLDTLALILALGLFGGCNTIKRFTHPSEPKQSTTTGNEYGTPPTAPVVEAGLEVVSYQGVIGIPITYAALPGAGQPGSRIVVYVNFRAASGWIEIPVNTPETKIGDPCYAYDLAGHFGPIVRFMNIQVLDPNLGKFIQGNGRDLYWVYLIRPQAVSTSLY